MNMTKTKLAAVVAFSTCALAAQAKEANYANVKKQLTIMENILKASGSSNKAHMNALRKVSSTYLAGQGAVFTIASNPNHAWSSFSSFVPVAPIAPSAPVATVYADSMSFSYSSNDIEQMVEHEMEAAENHYEAAMEAAEHQREMQRDLAEAQRDLRYEVRDLEREARDLQYQVKRLKGDDLKEVKAELAKIAEKKQAVEQERAKVAEKVAKVKKATKEKLKERAKKRVLENKALVKNVVDTFCLYGNGLRAVPKSENVTLIVKYAGEKLNNKYQDQVFVFRKKDLIDCSSEKISSDKLLSKATSYQI